jgi:hypothetical protein
MTTDAKPRIHIRLVTLRNSLINAIHESSQNVSLGLFAIEQCNEGEITVHDEGIKWIFGKPQESTPASRKSFSQWIVGAGLQFAITKLELFLVDVSAVTSVIQHCKDGQVVAPISGTLDEIIDHLRDIHMGEFEKRLWPAKLSYLKKNFGITSNLETQLLTITRLRNCLTHRGGIVGDKDVTDSHNDSLTMEYIDHRLMALLPGRDEKQQLEVGDSFPKDTQITVERSFETLTFKKGERVSLTVGQFQNTLYTLLHFGEEIIKSCEHLIQSKGIDLNEVNLSPKTR